ncbi:ribulose-phosphate 3-epimerase [Anaerovibrio sp.]|uniref:ribulose-phosphate 3-epimerase n=1 Tax=Anaerovibrio sp. TaxID=1872532 RepID=UPI003F18FD9D
MNTKLSPSVFAANLATLADDLKILEENNVELLHVDVMDGHFVERMAFGADHIAMLKKMTSMPLDVHLMIERPENHIEAIAAAGADIITIHVESTTRLYSCLQKIRKLGKKCGVVLSPGTPAEAISCVAHLVDMVLIMTVNPGEGGQHFLPDMTDKIMKVRSIVGPSVDVEVDGGIDAGNIAQCHRAGANVFVSGGYLFKGDKAANIRAMREAIA